jgi:aminoglycoside 3-N-acetyltransferase
MTDHVARIRSAVVEHGIAGRAVCLHTSLRSFDRPVPRAENVIAAFTDAGCTLMANTGSHGVYGTDPPAHMRPARNGTDYAGRWHQPHDRIFTPDSVLLDGDLGTLPRVLLSLDGHVRGNHPLSSFTAIGPLANDLVGPQRPDDVAAPLRRLADLDGCVVLAGVGYTRMTLIHLAEELSGRARFRRWALGRDGAPMMVEAGSCSEGFGSFESVLEPAAVVTRVAGSVWTILDARTALERATAAIVADPAITHCGTECIRCDDAVAGGPIL